MALIIQNPVDPSTSANSYLSVADARTRAAYLGVTLSTDDAAAEVQLRIGMRYVDAKNYVGREVIPFQGTKWPREQIYLYRDGEQYEYSTDVIPEQVLDALVIVAAEDDVYSSVTAGERTKSAKVDVIQTEYFDDGNIVGFKRITRADVLLSQFVYSEPNIMYVV